MVLRSLLLPSSTVSRCF